MADVPSRADLGFLAAPEIVLKAQLTTGGKGQSPVVFLPFDKPECE